MSKEREDFERITASEYEGEFAKYADGEYVNEAQERHFLEFFAGYRAATTYYQPLLEAKDAEIARLQEENRRIYKSLLALDETIRENTTLKALLEQARERERATECRGGVGCGVSPHSPAGIGRGC